MLRVKTWTAAALAVLLSACSDDSSGGAGAGGVAGSGGVVAGSGGVVAGSGGVVAGSGGTVAGMSGTMDITGGVMAGTGGMVAGTGGMMAGTGGMMAGTGGTGGMDHVPGSPTFSAIFAEIIVGTGCNAPGLCHGGVVGMLQMLDKQATYDALVNTPAMGVNLTGDPPHCMDSGLTRVVPGDPANSLLMQKLDGVQPCGDKMPPTAELDSAKIEQVRTWIQNGAMND